jgi:hypothetical protein
MTNITFDDQTLRTPAQQIADGTCLEQSQSEHTPLTIATTEEERIDADACPELPGHVLIGSLGELAQVLTEGTEIPEGFVFASALTMLGAMCSGELTADGGLDSDTRLYTVLYGDSADAKKSSAMKRTLEFFESLKSTLLPETLHGLGSAEGLARKLKTASKVLLCFDELRSFVDKAGVQGSVLLPMATSLYENRDWDNVVKNRDVCVKGARISLLGCATRDTYERMWSTEATAIGFINRLFLIGGRRRSRIAWPARPDAGRLAAVRTRILSQLGRLPLTLRLSSAGRAEWERWYTDLPSSPHTKRLDTIGRRLLVLMALTTDKTEIDAEIVRVVVDILNYELRIRRLSDPIDAENQMARVEEKIRRALGERGTLTKRDLHRACNANRCGAWFFNTALMNLLKTGEIRMEAAQNVKGRGKVLRYTLVLDK